MNTPLKSLPPILLLGLSIAALSCGSSSKPAAVVSSMSGNWLITLSRHNSTQKWTFSGFLLQSGQNVTGSFILGAAGCQGVGPVNGTFDGQNLQLTIGALGQDFSLTGSSSTGNSTAVTSLAGQFTDPAGGCISFASTGTWTAVRIPPLSGSFHGTIVSVSPPVTLHLTGTLTQGENTGASAGTISGTINATGPPSFCNYLTNSTVSGTISGTSASLNFYGPDGSLVGEIPYPGSTGLAVVAEDGTSLSGSFLLSPITSTSSTNCFGLSGGTGTATLMFP